MKGWMDGSLKCLIDSTVLVLVGVSDEREIERLKHSQASQPANKDRIETRNHVQAKEGYVYVIKKVLPLVKSSLPASFVGLSSCLLLGSI